MKPILILLSLYLIALLSPVNSRATVIDNPVKSNERLIPSKLLSLSAKEFEKVTGRHLSFKEKVVFKLLKWKFRNAQHLFPDKKEEPGKYDKMAKKAMLFGIGAFVLLFIPYIGILSIPSAVLGIVLGAVSLNKVEKKTNSILGIVFGSVFIVLLFAILVAAFAIFATR